MTFTTPGAVLARELPPDYAADIADVLDAAQMWADGRMSLTDAARFGTIEYHDQPSPRYSRYVAMVKTPLDHPQRPALVALVNRLRSEERRVGKECRSRWWADH